MFKLQRLEITGFKSFADHTEIVFTGNGITAVVGPNGCGKCVSGDTPVTLTNGSEVSIRELVDGALGACFLTERNDDGFTTRENPHNVEVFSLNPESLKFERRKVSAFVKRKAPETLLSVKTRSGRIVDATAYHPLFTLNEGKIHALRADELKPGVRVAVPRSLKPSNTAVAFASKDVLDEFSSENNVFAPNSRELVEWTTRGMKMFGSLESWASFAGVPRHIIGGIRNGQAANIGNLKALALGFENPPLDNIIASKRTGKACRPDGLSTDLAQLLGLLLAEGRNTSSSQVWFVNSDQAINGEFERIVESEFGLKVVRRNYKKNCTDSLVFSKSLCRLLEKRFNFRIDSDSFERKYHRRFF